MTARKTVRQVNKVPDFALVQKRVADAMWALPQWLPDNVLENDSPSADSNSSRSASGYAFMTL
jgi:hypothetical protein